ncbi:MFS general substrate transporter [Xylaria palmicola]|nr:MFS general substrate transporter [Xylaria palmicola]
MTQNDNSARTAISPCSNKRIEERIPYWHLLFDQAVLPKSILDHQYRGGGTEESPYVVEWLSGDPRNPFGFPMTRKVFITLVMALASLSVSFSSSAYLTPAALIAKDFETTQEVVTLGLFTFNVGQAVGPFLWGPLSELYGRQAVFIGSFAGVTAFNGGCWASQNIATLVVLRFFTGLFASSPLTNAGGIIADMFPPAQRGLAMSAFVVSPYLGPAIGPIVSGFVAEAGGWRWVEGVMTIFTGSMFLLGSISIPETYAPVLLRRRAARMSKLTGNVYQDVVQRDKGPISARRLFANVLFRPWRLLFGEPIVLILSLYMAIIYGTLYSFFGAFPIVYEEVRGWSLGIGGLAFTGVAIGMIFGVMSAIWVNVQYRKTAAAGKATPETRMKAAMIGSILVPVSLFWFAWTNFPSISALASIAAGVPFGTGMVLVYLAVTNYLVDSYTIYASSALAANAALRCIFGAVFPLFTPAQYHNLGIHWAATIPAFLALACVPFPWLFYRYGRSIRLKCKYSAEAERVRQLVAGKGTPPPVAEEQTKGEQGVVESGHSTDKSTVS